MAGPNIQNFAGKVVFLNGQPVTLPTASANPGTAVAGDMYYNLVTGTINYYNGTIWISLGVTNSNYTVNTFILTASNITNQYVTLSSAPSVPTDTVLTVIGGPMQHYSSDFAVSGFQLNFLGDLATGGPAALIFGDILVIQYH